MTSHALQLRHGQQSFLAFFQKMRLPAFFTSVGTRVTLAVLTVCLVVGYVLQIGVLTTSGYQIATLEKQVDSLSDDTQKLTSELAGYQAISNVEKRLQPGTMVPATNIRHIKIGGETAMAQ